MSEKTYQISKDSNNRLCAELSDDVVAGFKMLEETDQRRIDRGEHAYVVIDIATSLGSIRIREVRVLWSEVNQRFFLRWKQWKTGKVRDGRPEYLDVAGPHDRLSRDFYAEAILAVFNQIKQQGLDQPREALAPSGYTEETEVNATLDHQLEALKKLQLDLQRAEDQVVNNPSALKGKAEGTS